jgi:predicted nucleotidyltransferase component of viral defense system
MDYPVILDQPVPQLLVYSKETAIAEKFEAIVRLGTANSRMKDFYDILYLAQHEEFEAQILWTAITTTFAHRGTDLKQAELIFAEEFIANRTLREMWGAFLKRSALDPTIPFSDTMDLLRAFLSHASRHTAENAKWLPHEKRWDEKSV